jgi:O-succinylbenzoic acid--CoA ligase
MIPIVPITAAGPDALDRAEAAWDAGAAALPLPADASAGPTTAPPGTALVVRTSGSTGRPRHVALAHDALTAAVQASLARLDCAPGDRWALALPTHHIAGLLVLLRARALGAGAVVVARPGEATALAGVDTEHVAVVSTQLVRALRAGVDLTRFRTVLVGGGPLDPKTRDAARERGVRVVTTYGATETCGGVVYDGVPLSGVRVDVTDDGEVRIAGPTLAIGYVDDAESTHARFRGGWFATGDAGRVVDGLLEILGRRDDVAVSGGVNVPLDAVAAALRTAPGVGDAVAVGVPDPEWGTLVRAVIVPTGGTPPRLTALRDRIVTALPRTHAPRELLIVDRIDRDALGKVTAAARAGLVRMTATERLQ